MNRTELAAAVAETHGLSKSQADAVLRQAFEVITEQVAQGNDVTIHGFGTFTTGKRAARTGKNPRTGEALQIAAATTAKFKPAAALRTAVNV